MSDPSKSATTPLLLSPDSYSTYGGNDDEGRQAPHKGHEGRSKEEPHFRLGPSLNGLFLDHTFSAAMMHSVGSLGRDEYVDSRGVIHTITIRKRRRQTIASGAPALSKEKNILDHERLQDLFMHKRAREQSKLQPGERDDMGTIQDPSDGRSFIAVRPKHETKVIEGEEYEVQDQVEGGSITAAVFGVIKGTVGPAILYLPKGFQQAGWACAIPSLIVATFAYIYSAHRLLQCWKVEDSRQQFLARRMSEIQSFLEKYDKGNGEESNVDKMGDEREGSNQLASGLQKHTSEYDRRAQALDAFKPKLLTYPELARRAFGSFSFLIEFGIAAMQFGVCLTYLIFVPANLYASCQTLFGIAIPKTYFLIGMLLIEIPCTWIRDIRQLTPFNVLATILIIYGLGSCLIISFLYSYAQKDETLFESLKSLPAIQPAWFMFIGTAFFVFEGSITLVVPLQEAVYRKEDRERFPMVNQNVTICIVLFYMAFALVVWATFEDQVQTALTASLPRGNFSTSVQFAYSIAVILTYPLQAFPALEVVLKDYGNTDSWEKKKNLGGVSRNNRFIADSTWCNRNFLVSLLNIGLGIIAVIAIDYLGNVVSLLGSLVGMPIALVYPPIMHNVLVKQSSFTTRCMNYFVSGVGLIATVAASYATIANWDEGGE
jgi:proton-coupled amino acid transporter